MNAISTRETPTAALTFGDIEKLAEHIAKSGLFGIKTKEQAVVLMMIAQAEGRHPALAARDYNVIGGRGAKTAEAMMRDFLEGGGKVQWHTLDDDEADATFSHPAGGTVRINWNMARAAKAGLAAKENYKKFTRQMLRSRTVSEGVRTVYPLATSGMYVPEEAADFAGPILEGSAEPLAPKPRRKTEAANNSVSMQVGGTGLPDTGGNDDAAPPTWLEHYTAALTNERSLAQFVVTFADACATCSSEPDLVRLMGVDIVKRALEKGAPEIKDQITKASSNAFRRLTPPASTQPNLALDTEVWNPETGEITPEERARA